MTEKEFPFTEEQIRKHLRFLTKEDIQEGIEELKGLPNLYHQKEKILNTEDMDNKFREYLAEGIELSTSFTSDNRVQVLANLSMMVLSSDKKLIGYTPTEPEEKDPDVFYITDEVLNFEGQQFKHTDSFMGITGHYFYTGSIEDKTDSGFFMDISGPYVFTLPNPEEQTRTHFKTFRDHSGFEV